MNKTFKQIAAKIILGISLSTLGTLSLPSKPASAAIIYNQNEFGMQTIYRENGYAVAVLNVSPVALSEGIYMYCENKDSREFQSYSTTEVYYPKDGSSITVEPNGDKYIVTFKVNLSVFKNTSNLKAYFYTGGFSENIHPSFEDDNNGKYYTI